MTISWNSTSSGTTASGTLHQLTKPTVNTGDLLVYLVGMSSAGTTIFSTDLSVPKWDDSSFAARVMYRVIDGTEGSTLDFTLNIARSTEWVCHRFTTTGTFSKYPIRGMNSYLYTNTSAVRQIPGCQNATHTGMSCVMMYTPGSSVTAGTWVVGGAGGLTERDDQTVSSDSFAMATYTSDGTGFIGGSTTSVTQSTGIANTELYHLLLREEWKPGGTAKLRVTGRSLYGSGTNAYSRQRSGGSWPTPTQEATWYAARMGDYLGATIGGSEADGDRAVGPDRGINNAPTVVNGVFHVDYPPDDMDTATGAITAATVYYSSVDDNTYGDDSGSMRVDVRYGANSTSNMVMGHTLTSTSQLLDKYDGTDWTATSETGANGGTGTAPAYGKTKTFNAVSGSITLAQAEDLHPVVGWLDSRNMASDSAVVILADLAIEITYDVATGGSTLTGGWGAIDAGIQ